MQKDLDFFAAYQSPGDNDRRNNTVLLGGTIGLSVIVVVLLLAFAGLHLGDAVMQAQITSAKKYINNSTVQKANSTLSAAQTQITALNQYANTASGVVSVFNQNPKFGSGVMQLITGAMPTDVSIQSLTYTDGKLTLACFCTDKLSPARFVASLSGISSFTDVSYTGFFTNSGGFGFNVGLSVKGGGQS